MAPARRSLEHLRLSPEELRLAGLKLFGEAPGWQSRLASEMGFDRSAITRWLNGVAPVPLHASLLVRYMLTHGTADSAGITGPLEF